MRQAIQHPDGRLLFVPVRSTDCGAITLRTGRLASGRRIGLAFTSEAALVATLGAGQRWINLAAPLVPGMFAEAGATETRIDPLPVAVQAREVVVAAEAIAADAAEATNAAETTPAADAPRRPTRHPVRRPVRHVARPTAVRHAY